VILLLTIVNQVRAQWNARVVPSASRWLFIGQTAASLGFTIYSLLLHNWVFTFTNGMLFLSALVGSWIALRKRQSDRSHSGRLPREPS